MRGILIGLLAISLVVLAYFGFLIVNSNSLISGRVGEEINNNDDSERADEIVGSDNGIVSGGGNGGSSGGGNGGSSGGDGNTGGSGIAGFFGNSISEKCEEQISYALKNFKTNETCLESDCSMKNIECYVEVHNLDSFGGIFAVRIAVHDNSREIDSVILEDAIMPGEFKSFIKEFVVEEEVECSYSTSEVPKREC